jgi:hypothetical protein
MVPTEVFLATATATSTTLSGDHPRPSNHLDVASTAGFARDDVVLVGTVGVDGEYLTVQYVDAALGRLWFASPAQSYAVGNTVDYPIGTQKDHLGGAGVLKVTLTPAAGGSWSLAAASGLITETPELGNGGVVVSYTSDFVVPDVYPVTFNASPELDDSVGKWTGKSLEDGTYTLGLWGNTNLSVTVAGPPPETTTYRGTSPAATVDFAVGGADPLALEPYALISGAQNCYDCHQDMYFHGGGRRGVETCLLCHGTIGAEDRPTYVAANAHPTTGVQVSFREMLHKLHMGKELANASSYEVMGFGQGYPNNYSVVTYAEVGFPAMPGGVRHCESCHGAGSSAWLEPAERGHSTQQVHPVKKWTAVCGTCHDSTEAAAHIAGQTTGGGVESCEVCHEPGAAYDVLRIHEAY